MSKSVAIITEDNKVIAINEYPDDYELVANQIIITNPAYVGGDYFEGFFYPEQPYPSWLRNGQGNWKAPVPYPNDKKEYRWDEELGIWDEIIYPQKNQELEN